MELSFSTNAFVKYPVTVAVSRIAALGYAGVELLADAPHLYADRVGPEDILRTRRALEHSGIKPSNINANTAVGFYGREFWEPLFEPSLAHPDRALRNWRTAYSKKCVAIAKELGCPCISVTSGRMVPGVQPDVSLGFLRDSLSELLDYAHGAGVKVGVEYEPGLLIESAEQFIELKAAVNSPLLGVNLDLGHSRVLGEDPAATIQLLASHILHTHIEDIRGKRHYHLIPGTGDMDFAELFRLLAQSGYEGYLTVELYTYPDNPADAAEASIRHLAPILRGLSET